MEKKEEPKRKDACPTQPHSTSSSSSTTTSKTFKPNKHKKWLKNLPEDLWDSEIIPYFGFKDLALYTRLNHRFNNYYQKIFIKNTLPIHVPHDAKTISNALQIGQLLHTRHPYTTPLLIRVAKGNYGTSNKYGYGNVIDINLNFSITIEGKGIQDTIFKGGFYITKRSESTQLTKLRIQNMSIVESEANGLFLSTRISDTATNTGVNDVELDNVCIKECERSGIAVYGSTLNMNNVECSYNQLNGVYVTDTYKKLNSVTINSLQGVITISGENRLRCLIHNNCLRPPRRRSRRPPGNKCYGLHVFGSNKSNSIRIVQPLTKESISCMNLSDSRNWSSKGPHTKNRIYQIERTSL